MTASSCKSDSTMVLLLGLEVLQLPPPAAVPAVLVLAGCVSEVLLLVVVPASSSFAGVAPVVEFCGWSNRLMSSPAAAPPAATVLHGE